MAWNYGIWVVWSLSCIFNNFQDQSVASAAPLSLTQRLAIIILGEQRPTMPACCIGSLRRTSILLIVAALQHFCWLLPGKPTERYSLSLRKWTDNTSAVKWLLQVIEHLAGFQYSRWEKIRGCNPWMNHNIASSPPEQPVWALPVNPCTHP